MWPPPDFTDLIRSPAWYPLSATGDDASMVSLTEADYVTASFLDERLLGQKPPQATVAIEKLRTAASALTPNAHYIFHIGHVGSTLISRLLGAHAGIFSVREPALLRTVPAELPMRDLLALLARTWWTEQRTVIKATSVVNEIAARILATGEAPRAILIYATPLAYLRGILGGPNSRIESRALAPARWRRFCRRFSAIGSGAVPRTEGEWIAMSWLCEMGALVEAAQRVPSRTHWVDFDDFLRAPSAGLAAIFGALGTLCADSEVEALANGPIMQRYSKAPEYAYDAALRWDVLQSADQQHGAQVRQGMKWLETAAQADASVRQILR
jgi:hypothetical protein